MNTPGLTPDGNYDPVQVFEYLQQCRAKQVPHYQIAEALHLEQHRVTYAMGFGWDSLRRQAAIARLTRIGMKHERANA